MFDVIPLEWTAFKDALRGKGLLSQIQFIEDDTLYEITAYDTPIKYVCLIYKGTVPDGVIVGYPQVQNDADKQDFEVNFKSEANKRLTSSIEVSFEDLTVIDGYTTTTSTDFAPIEGTTYTEQSGNAQRSVVSTSTDDADAGTGARSVTITYFDEDMAGPFTEVVGLDGTSPVDTVADNICYIERIDVVEVGSQLGNVGTVHLKSTTGGGGITVGSIPPGDNETNWVHHYVADGKVASILNIYAHIRGIGGGNAHLRVATPTIDNTPEKTVAPVLRVSPGTQSNLELPVPLSVLGPARITLYARPDASASHDWIAGFNYFEDDA